MNIEKATQLLEEFIKIPRKYKDSTYLELCHYPKRRIEEICSRLLAFYFDPLKEHGFNDLFICSLLELLPGDLIFESTQLDVITEDYAEGKRIDLVIVAEKFVIGIENKITASLYNPLEIYSKRLGHYHKKTTIKLVLSIFDITVAEEKALMKKHGFISITYNSLFEVIKRNIGYYIAKCNPKYLTHLFDFIDTIENMRTSSYKNSELSGFFIKYEEEVKTLIEAYNGHKKELRDFHRSNIIELKDEMTRITGDKWWNWEDYFLGVSRENNEKIKIGIEGNFKPSKNDPIDMFIIYFTTWTPMHFNYYRDKLGERYPEKILNPIRDKNKTLIEVGAFKGNNFEQIIKELTECHKFLLKITESDQPNSN